MAGRARFGAYRTASRIVAGALGELSPLVEPLSLDEAFVDLAASPIDVTSTDALQALAGEVRAKGRPVRSYGHG